jgi:hypothetical protein
MSMITLKTFSKEETFSLTKSLNRLQNNKMFIMDLGSQA